jgi:hypothetical protein
MILKTIFKEYFNLVYRDGQKYEITPFYGFCWFLLVFTSIFGYGPGSETLKLRIRIWQKFQILADPDPQHWFQP